MRLRFTQFPFILDIMDIYAEVREQGYSREDAVAGIRQHFADHPPTPEEASLLPIGLAAALCRKKELTTQLRDDALSAIRELCSTPDFDGDYLQKAAAEFAAPENLGPQAAYRKKASYDPGWQVGDTFAHRLTCDLSQKFGIYGWTALFRKVGEYPDRRQKRIQLCYVTLCPPGTVPSSSAELEALGLLRMMARPGNTWDYLTQLPITGPKALARYGFTPVGNFPGIPAPEDAAPERPLVSYGLFCEQRTARDGHSYPNMEDSICLAYHKNGLGK